MTKFEIGVGMLATVVCFAAGAQTINVTILDQAGAQTVLQAGRENAEQRNAPSAIAVVDLPAICFLSSGWMMSARQA